jgi:hypothetical protein
MPKNIHNDPPFTTVHEWVRFTTWDGPLLKASRMILQVRSRSDSVVSSLLTLKPFCDVLPGCIVPSTSAICLHYIYIELLPLLYREILP